MDEKEEKIEEKNNFKDYTFERNYKKEFENLNIYNLIKSDLLLDKKEALERLKKYFNEIESNSEKYEILIKSSEEIFPFLLNISIPSFKHEKNNKNIELYINIGKFLLLFLFNNEYILDFSDFINNKDISQKFPCLLLYNKTEIINIRELDNKRYKLLQYDILKKYRKELLDIYIKYFISPIIIYDMNFDIQYIIFEMLKYLYFLCDDIDSKNLYIKYISEVLTNLSQFKNQTEYDKSLISREFGYFLLLHETNFKSFNNSLTISPKNESDIYTTKFNVAKDLMNRILYIKKEIKKGKSFEIIENMNKKYSILYLEFFIEDNKEISLTIYKKNETNKNFEQIGFNNIVKTVKMDEDKEKENNYKIAKIIVVNNGNSLNKENEISYKNQFKIVFDNYDSWFTNRIIYYSISIFEKTDE